jgi:hypothetical protein
VYYSNQVSIKTTGAISDEELLLSRQETGDRHSLLLSSIILDLLACSFTFHKLTGFRQIATTVFIPRGVMIRKTYTKLPNLNPGLSFHKFVRVNLRTLQVVFALRYVVPS